MHPDWEEPTEALVRLFAQQDNPDWITVVISRLAGDGFEFRDIYGTLMEGLTGGNYFPNKMSECL